MAAIEENDVWRRLDKSIAAHFLEDCPSWTICQSPKLTLQGHSIAGERTGFHIPELRLFLDGGMNSYKTCAAVLLTHGHSDHSHNLPCVAMGMNGVLEKRPPVYAPEPVAEPVRMLGKASQALNDCRPLGDCEEMNVVAVRPGHCFDIGDKNKLRVRPVQCYHTVPSIGYQLALVGSKLRPELHGRPGAELKQLRAQGHDINVETERPLLTFLGDTTVEVFERQPDVFQSPIIMVECTGFPPRQDAATTTERGHVHWTQLVEHVRAHPDITFIVMHFSRSLKETEILQVVLADRVPNVLLWFDSGVIDVRQLL